MAVYPRRILAPAARGNNSFATMVVVSLLLHVVLGVVVWRGVVPRRAPQRPPAYLVDLVTLPTLSPGVTAANVPRPAVASAPRTEPPPPGLKPAVPRPAPSPPVTSAPVAVSDSPADVIATMRARKALDERIAALRKSDPRKPLPAAAPVPSRPTSTPGKAAAATVDTMVPVAASGDPGAPYAGWLHDTLKDYWTYSPYQGNKAELEASFTLYFDFDGRLVNFEIGKSSQDSAFDASAKRAILRLKKLPTAPGRPFDQPVIFNLKELRAP